MSKTIRILYADDDADDAFLFETIISDIDIDCDLKIFPSGIALIDHLKTCRQMPDMIFLDINMPLKNGLECLTEIKTNNNWEDIPIYIFSTSDAEVYKQSAVSKGAFGYIAKPHSFSEMREVLSNAIQNALPGVAV